MSGKAAGPTNPQGTSPAEVSLPPWRRSMQGRALKQCPDHLGLFQDVQNFVYNHV